MFKGCLIHVTSLGHNNLDEALEIYQRTQPQKMLLTHIGHDLHVELQKRNIELPLSVVAGWDGLTVTI